MPFKKGESGNLKGRPKLTEEQKKQKEHFKRLLQESTVTALESIINISKDKNSKDRFNACKYIVDKAYGSNTGLLIDDADECVSFEINVVPYQKKEPDDDWDDIQEDEEFQ